MYHYEEEKRDSHQQQQQQGGCFIKALRCGGFHTSVTSVSGFHLVVVVVVKEDGMQAIVVIYAQLRQVSLTV